MRWEIASDDTFQSIVQSGNAVADPNLAHSVHVEVTGLDPARDYFYRFMAGGDVSPVGRTKTAPAPGADVDLLRFAFASCANYEHGYFAAYREMADQAPDLVFHLGDYLYEYAPNDWQVRDGGNLREVLGEETVRLADFSVLDTRQYRSDQPCDEGLPPRCPAATDPATSLLRPEQERWLLQKLEQSPAI